MDDLRQRLLSLNHAIMAATSYRNNLHIDDSKKILKMFEILESKLKQLTHELRTVFLDRERASFKKLKQLMTIASKMDPSLKVVCNRIYVSKYHPSDLSISQVFEQFIKGITYYEWEEPEDKKAKTSPIYHRLFSCGPRTDTPFATVLADCGDYDIEGGIKRRDAEKRIEKCYIERKIYDELFKKLDLHFPYYDENDMKMSQSSTKIQDKGHRDWLEETATAFRQCFPNMDFEVEVRVDGIIPIQVRIVKLFCGKPRKIWLCTRKQSGFIHSQPLYEDDTEKLIWNGRKYYIQYTSFMNEGPLNEWREKDPPNLELNPEGFSQ